MEYIIILIAAFVAAILIGIGGIKAQTVSEKSKVSDVTRAESKTLSRAGVKQRLETLAKSKPPEIRQVSAMCYDMAGPPTTANYICPKCGEKTLYTLEQSEKGTNICQKIFALESCRHMVKTLGNLKMELDESQFCKKCSPDVKSPEINLIIKYEGEKEHRVNNISEEDVKLIYEFGLESDIHSVIDSETMSSTETPLKDHVKRLSELLGVEIEIPAKTKSK